MAKSFNLTAELNLRGPSNLGPVVSQIRKELGNITASVDIKVNKGTDRSLLTINNALNRLNNTLARTSTLSASTSSSIGDLTRSIDVLRNSLNGSTNSMTRVVASTRQVANQMSRTTRNIQQSSDAMEEFGRQSRLAVKRFAAFSVATGAIYALINAISKASSEFIEFDRQITRLTQITGDSKDSLSKITDTITALSTNLGVTSSDLIKVSDTLAQAGLSAKQTEQALKALAASALAPSFDSLNDTVEGSIALMRQFKIGTQDLEKALGSINAVAAGFAVEASDIITAIQRSGGVFAAASKGVSEGTDALNEFIAVFTSVRATTRESAETIATGLRTIFTRIQRESTIDALKEYGVNLQDVEGKFVGAYKAVQLLSEGLGKLDPRDVKFSRIVEELGGFRQIGKVLPLIQEFATAQQALGVAERGQASLTKDVIKAQASLAIQFAKTREKFVALIRDIGNSGSFQALVKVGLTLADTFIKVVDVARPLLPIITALAAFKGGEALTKFVGGFVGGVRSGGGAGAVGNNLGQGITGARARQGAAAAQNNLRGLTANTHALHALVNPLDSLRASIVDLTNQIQSSQRAGGGGRGLSQGGVVKFARGGIVPGSGNSDTVPAMLQPGEFVIRKKAVETIGASNLQRMNRYAKGGPVVQKFKEGSIVQPSTNTEKAHFGSQIELSPEDFKKAVLSTRNKKLAFAITEATGQSPPSQSGLVDNAQKLIQQLNLQQLSELSKKINLEAKKNIKLNIPASFNQALRRGNPDLVGKNDLINWISANSQTTASLPKELKGKISNRYIAQKISNISPAKSNKFGIPAYDIDDELASIGDDIAKEYTVDSLDLMFRGSSAEFIKKLGLNPARRRAQDRVSGIRLNNDSIQKSSIGGLIQRLASGGMAQSKTIISSSPSPMLQSIIADIEKNPKRKDYAFKSYQEELASILNQAYKGILKSGTKPVKNKITRDSIVSMYDEHTGASRYIDISVGALEDDLKYITQGNIQKRSLKKRQGIEVGDMLDVIRSYQGLGLDYTLNTALATNKTNQTLGQFQGKDLSEVYKEAGLDKVKLSTFVKQMNAAAQYKFPKKLYSGLGDSKLDLILKHTNTKNQKDLDDIIGKTFIMPSFLSASDSEALAGSFARTGMLTILTNSKRKGIIPEKSKQTTINRESQDKRSKKLRILQKVTGQKGFSGLDIDESYTDAYDSEGEYIFPSNSKFKVLSVDKFGTKLFDKDAGYRNLNMEVQQLQKGGVAQRRVGYIDYDVISNPIHEEIIKKGMKSTGTAGPRLYADKLTEMAVKARKNSSIQKLKAIYGVAGSGKTTLARGQGTDDAKLRKTERFPILSPEDIEKATEVLVLSSSVNRNKLDEIFSKTDKTFTLSSTTDAEKDRVRSQRNSRDITGIGLEGRTPGVTAGVSTDTAVGEALLADRLGSKSVVLGRGAGGNLRRKRGNELVEIIKKKIGFTWGSFSPMTAGHESIMDAAAAMGIAPEDFLYLVGSNESIKAGDPSTYRTAVFDQDFRVMLAKAGAGAKGARVLPKPRDFEIPQGFDITPEGSGRRKVLLPGKGSRTFVGDKTPEQTTKYKEAGYSVSHIERTGSISGTMVRDLIMSGDMGKLQQVLSPGVYDLISNNINKLQNRAKVLPDIIEQVKKSQESSLTDIDQQIKVLGISRIDNKKASSDPEYAAKVEILQELRAKREKIKSAGSFEPYKLLADMARKEPEKYGLDLSTSTSTLKPIRTVSSQTVQKAAFGGLIKSLANSGLLQKYADGEAVSVDNNQLARYGQIGILAKKKIESGKNILEAIKETAVEQLSAIGGESKLKRLTSIPTDLTRRFRKNLIEDGTLDLVEVSQVLSDALSSKGTDNAAEEQRIASLAKTAIVGLQPLDYSKNFNWKLDKGDREIYTYVRGFSSQFLPEVMEMQQKSAAMSREFSNNLEMKAALGSLSESRKGIYGPLRPLAIDFDNTLALNSRMTRMINGKEEEDIPAYGDSVKVSDNLKNAKPSALAQRLAQVEKLNPGIIRSFTRILTARPQSTADLIAQVLNSWGLPYEKGDITGLSQDVGAGKKFSGIPQAKAANLAQIEKLIDDTEENIKEVRKQGKDAYHYGEIPSFGNSSVFQEKMGQGNVEGSALEAALAFKLGYPINLDTLQRNRAVDFPDGLGRGAQLFGIDPHIPTEVKRTLDGSSFNKAREEFTRYFEENPSKYNIGGIIKRFANGGQSEDTVPALLTPGEFVINKKAAQKIGYGKLHNLNRADKIQGYNKGGVVGVQRLNVGGTVASQDQIKFIVDESYKALGSLPDKLNDAVNQALDLSDSTPIKLGDTFDAINKKLRQQLTAALRDIDNLGPEVVEGIRTVLGAGVKALNTLELNTVKASPSYKPTDDATRDRVDDAKQARRAYQSRPVAGKTLMDYMRDQIGSPTPISSSRGRSAADYERMLDYSDVKGQRSDIGDSGRAYAAQLAKMDPQSVDAIAKAMREEFTKAMGAAGQEPSKFGKSQSWALWEIGKQSFMNQNPARSSSKYRLADPLTDTQVRREGVQRMIGWEAERMEGKTRPSSSNVLRDKGADLLDSVGFKFTDLADTAQQLDKQLDITKIKLVSIAEALADIPSPSIVSPGSPSSGGGGGRGSPPAGGGGTPPGDGGGGPPPGDGGGGPPSNSGGRFVSRRRAQFNALTQANKDYESIKDFGHSMLLLGSVVTGGLGVFKQFFSKTSLVSRGLDSLANSAGAVTGAFVAVTQGTDLLNKILTSKQAGSLVKSLSNRLASSGIGDKIASLGQRGGKLAGTEAGTLARRAGSALNRNALGQLANPQTAAKITNTITKIAKLAAPAAALASGLYAAANAFSDITDQIRRNKEELLADQVDKGLQRFDQALAEYTKNTIDNGNQLAAASSTLASVANKQAQLADMSKTNPKYGLTNIIGEGVGGLGGLLQAGGSTINALTEAMGMKTRIGGSGMEGVSQRAEILDKQGVMAYLGSLLDVTGSTQYQNAKKLAPEQAMDTSKLFQPLLEKQNSVIDAQFKKGQTSSDIIGGADWKAQAEIIARSNAALEEQTRLIDADLSVSKSARQAKINEIRSNYAANELKKREISYLKEKQGKQLDRESKDYTNSLNRMFDNMEQAIDATSFKLEKMADAADLAANSLTGSAKVGGVKLDAINILKNPNIYGSAESNRATNMASSFFGDDKKTVGALLSVGPKIEKSILSTINTTLAENSDASEGKISAKINNAISEDLDRLNLGKGIREKLSKQISDAITDARKNGEEKIDFSDLSEKVPALARSIDSAKRAQDTAIKALEFYQTAINNYAEGVNKTVDLIISANDRLREAQNIRVRSEIELAKTLGKKISLDTVKGAARASAESKAGTSDPFKIFNNINRLEGVRRFQQENMNNAGNKGLAGSRDVKAFGSQLGQTTMQLKENYSALKNLAENTEVASAALEKISELKAKTEAGMNILEKYITSGPRDQIKLSQAFQRLENNMNGQTNNIMDSINVQQAYNDAIANGASISEANLAAQNAGAEDRGATLDAFNMIAPFLGDRQGEMKANVLESMMKESGVQMTPMFNQVLQALRNPEADPQMSEAINEYKKAVELQAEANTYLAKLDSKLAIDVGRNTAAAFDQSASAKSLFTQAQKSDISNGILNSINVKLSDGTQKTQVVNTDKPRTLSRGGVVYMDVGGSIFQPKGTDTVPAMLTPGEFVVNKASAQANKGILSSINRGAKYYADGGWVSPDLNVPDEKRERGNGPYTIYDTFWTLGQSADIAKNIEKINSVQENIALLKPYSFPAFNKIPDDAFQSGYITHTSIKDKLLNSSYIAGESIAGIMPDFYMSKNVGSAALSGAGIGATAGAAGTVAAKGVAAAKAAAQNADGLLGGWLKKILGTADEAEAAVKPANWPTERGFAPGFKGSLDEAVAAKKAEEAARKGATAVDAATKAADVSTAGSVINAKNIAALGWEATKFVPVLGSITGGIDAVRAFARGDIAGGLMETFGALAGLVPIPGVGAVGAGVAKLGGRLLKFLNKGPVARALGKLTSLGAGAFGSIWSWGKKFGGNIFKNIGESKLFQGISSWLPKTKGGFFSTLLRNTGIGAVAGGTLGAAKAAVYDDQTPYITKSVQAKIKELLVTDLPKVSPEILKLGSVESIPGFSDKDTDFLTKDEWIAQKKAVSQWIDALSIYSEWNKVTKSPQSKEVFGINEGAYTEYLMGPRKITADKSYASVITGKTLSPDMVASQLGKPASDAWLKFKPDGYPGGETKLNKTTDAILAEQTKGMQMLSESAVTDESFMKAKDLLKKYYDTEIGSLNEAKDFTDKPPTEQKALKRSAKLQELMKGLTAQVSFKKEEIDNKAGKFGLEGSDSLEVYSPTIYNPKVWQSLFSEIKKIEDEDGFADGTKPVADKLLFDPSKPEGAFMATKEGQIMGMPWSASKFQIDQKWTELAKQKEEAAITKFVGLEVGKMETYAKKFTAAKTNEDIPIALTLRKIKRIPLVDMETGNESGAIEGGLFVENRAIKSVAAGFNPFYSMNVGLPKPYATSTEELDSILQGWVDVNFTSMDPTMIQLMAEGGQYQPVSGPSEGFLPVVKVEDKSRGAKRREAKASMTEGALPRLKFLTEQGMLFDNESRKVLTAADYYEGLDNFKEYMPQWIKDRMISTKLAKSAKDIAAENTLGFRDEDLPKLGDAIWQEVSNLDLPIKPGLQTAGDWKGLLSRDYGIESPDKIADEETLHQGVDYLGGIKQKVLEVTGNMNKEELNKAAAAESSFQTYMSALDFLYKISGGKGSNKGLSKTASDFVYKKYRSKVFDPRTGKRIPGSPFVNSETTTAVQGPAKDEGLRFQGGKTGLTTEFWNVDALLADSEFRKYILGYAKGKRSSQKLRSILTKGKGNEDLGEVDKSGLNNALKEAAKRTGISDQSKEDAAGAKIVSENGELKSVEMPTNIIDVSKQLTNDREIYDPVYRHALGETVLRYGDEGAKYWTQKPGDNTALAAWGTLWNEYRAKIQDMMLYLEQKDDLLFMPVSKGRTEIFPPAIAPLAGKVSEALGGLDLTTIAESLMSDPSGMGIYNILPDGFKGDPAKEQELLNSLKTIYSNNFDPNSLPHVYSEQGFKSYELMKQVYDAANEAYLLFSEFNDNLGTELIPPPIVYRPEEFAYGQLSEYGKALTLVKDNNASTIFEALQKQLQANEQGSAQNMPAPVEPPPTEPQTLARGGIVYRAAGGIAPVVSSVDFSPKGSDTVPAMLTPGEFVVNRSSTAKFRPVLEAINSGAATSDQITQYVSRGSYIKPKYYADGGNVTGNSVAAGVLASIGLNTASIAALESFNKSASLLSETLKNLNIGNITLSQESIEAINSFSNKFDGFVQSLLKVSIPPVITLTAKHDVNVNINGISVLKNIEGMVQQTVIAEVDKALNEMSRKNEGSFDV